MNFEYTEKEKAFRAEIRAWLKENLPKEELKSGDSREGFFQHVEWEKKLFADRWAVVSWPEEYGGRGASLVEWLIFEEEYWGANAPNRVTQNGIFLLGPTLFEFGTQEQKDRILRPMAAAEVLWAQAWSEPEAGSDLANVRATARKVDGGWRVSGQKTWSTRGAFCQGAYGLFRTDPNSERHRGLSYMMVALDQPAHVPEVEIEEHADASDVVIELNGRTKSLVPEFTIKGPMESQIADMVRALRERLESS